MFFIITEALIGAGLVLLGWVAADQSTGRAVALALHLANTFLLLGAIATTALAAGLAPGPGVTAGVAKLAPRFRWRDRPGTGVLTMQGLVLITGVSGAIAALGDTLFPLGDLSLLDAIRADFSQSSHVLIRLRVFHPVLAVVAALVALYHTQVFRPFEGLGQANRFGNAVALTVGAQIILGLLNVAWRAPVWMQLVHLAVADLLWVLLVAYAWEARWGVHAGRAPSARAARLTATTSSAG